MLDGAEGPDRGGDRLVRNPNARGRDRGRQHVFDIVPTANWDVAGGHEELAVEHQLVRAELCSRRDLAPAAEPLRRSGGPLGKRYANSIVGIQNGEVSGALGFEQPAFRGSVILERVVPIQGILSNVQSQRDMRAELRDGLELETRQLEHIPAILA